MRFTKTGSKTRAVTDTSARSHPGRVTSANILSTSATDRRAPAMHGRALATNRSRVLRTHRRVGRTVRIAHEPAKVEPVIACNFTPALPRFMQCDDIVEALTGSIRQEVRFLQAAPAKSS
jgi:hypothetical protein